MNKSKEVMAKQEKKKVHTIEDINAAMVLSRYVWVKSPHKRLQVSINKENKIEISQTEILELLMEFHRWQIEEINKLNK